MNKIQKQTVSSERQIYKMSIQTEVIELNFFFYAFHKIIPSTKETAYSLPGSVERCCTNVVRAVVIRWAQREEQISQFARDGILTGHFRSRLSRNIIAFARVSGRRSDKSAIRYRIARINLRKNLGKRLRGIRDCEI